MQSDDERRLRFTPIIALFPGQSIFGAAAGERSYVVSFTPGYGWAATSRGPVGSFVQLGKFIDQAAAEEACRAALSSSEAPHDR